MPDDMISTQFLNTGTGAIKAMVASQCEWHHTYMHALISTHVSTSQWHTCVTRNVHQCVRCTTNAHDAWTVHTHEAMHTTEYNG